MNFPQEYNSVDAEYYKVWFAAMVRFAEVVLIFTVATAEPDRGEKNPCLGLAESYDGNLCCVGNSCNHGGLRVYHLDKCR
jgi:hypothetical protein